MSKVAFFQHLYQNHFGDDYRRAYPTLEVWMKAFNMDGTARGMRDHQSIHEILSNHAHKHEGIVHHV